VDILNDKLDDKRQWLKVPIFPNNWWKNRW